MAQYFIEVVPTDVESFLSRVKTFQYSVKENIRPVSKFYPCFKLIIYLANLFVHSLRS